MQRLATAGAPLSQADIDYSSDEGESGEDWPSPYDITKEEIRSKTREFLCDGPPDATPSQFLRWLVDETACGMVSPEALLREYPWVPRIFTETKAQEEGITAARKELYRGAQEQSGCVEQALSITIMQQEKQ